jgi:4-amino-4-deoxy-L-arabinose transferase-like glycosyltransferase
MTSDQLNRSRANTPPGARGHFFLLLLFIAALGGVLRVYHLNARSLWLDEGFAVSFASRSILGIVTNTTETSPPLYFLLLHAWTSLFGTSEVALRALSVLFAVAAIVCTGLLGFCLCDRRTGLVAALLMAVMVFPIHYAREVRPYSVYLVLTLGSFYFCLKGLQDNRGRDWLGYLVFTVALSYTHNYWLFSVLGQNLYVLFFSGTRRPVLMRWLGLQAGVILCFSPWVIPLINQAAKEARGPWITRPEVTDLANAIRSYVAFLIHPLILWGYVILAALGAVPLTTPKRGQPVEATQAGQGSERWRLHLGAAQRSSFLLLWLVCPILVPFYLSQFLNPPIFVPRYSIGSIPALYLLLASGVWRVPTIFLRGLVIGAIALVSTASLQHYYFTSRGEARRNAEYYYAFPAESWRELVASLSQQVKPADVVVVSPEWSVPPFAYYAKDAIHYHGLPAVLKAEDRARLIASLDTITRGKERLWLVLRWDRRIRQAHSSGIEEQSIVEFLSRRYQPFDVGSSAKPGRAPALLLFHLTRPRHLTSRDSYIPWEDEASCGVRR